MLLKECNALLGQQHHALPLVNPLVSPPPASFAELLNWASLECHFPTYSLHNIAAPASGFMILFVDCHLRLLGDRTSLRRRACCESEAGPEAADVREGAANLGLATTHRDCAAIIAGARPGGRHRHSPPTRKLAVLTETYGDCIVPGTTFFSPTPRVPDRAASHTRCSLQPTTACRRSGTRFQSGGSGSRGGDLQPRRLRLQGITTHEKEA